jgi:transcriptional regulator with XRE-family HTH domain
MTSQGVDVAALYAALDAQRRAREISWRQVAKEAGVSPSTITRMKDSNRPDVDGFAALVGWLGIPAEEFMPTPKVKRKPEPASQIMTFLRARKELDPKSVTAIEDVIVAACRMLRKTGE